MSSIRLAFSSERAARRRRKADAAPRPLALAPQTRRLSSLEEGERAIVVEVRADQQGRADRLLALGVTPGTLVTMLQRFPGIVFLCDQTELAVERQVADAIIVRLEEEHS
jgi:Fe2+ transport system protein FeoA